VAAIPEIGNLPVLAEGPQLTVKPDFPELSIYAERAAWVRVYEDGGAVLFEKILEQGETYIVPPTAATPMLRAGNAGSVYLVKNGEAFGPVGKGTSVAKRVSLVADVIQEAYTPAAIVLPELLDGQIAPVGSNEPEVLNAEALEIDPFNE